MKKLLKPALIALCAMSAVPPAGATCGSANCFLITGTQEGVAVKGTVILDLSYRYVEQSRRLADDPAGKRLHRRHRLGLLHPSVDCAPLRRFRLGLVEVNGENDLDYRPGVEALVNGGVSFSPGEKVSWTVQVNARRTAHDVYLDTLVPSTGSTLIDLTPGIRVGAASSTSLHAFVQLPIHQDVNDAQLAPRPALLVGISRVL